MLLKVAAPATKQIDCAAARLEPPNQGRNVACDQPGNNRHPAAHAEIMFKSISAWAHD
jgi:hypothetical protein